MRTYRSETNVANLKEVGNWSISEVIFDQIKAFSNHPSSTAFNSQQAVSSQIMNLKSVAVIILVKSSVGSLLLLMDVYELGV